MSRLRAVTRRRGVAAAVRTTRARAVPWIVIASLGVALALR